jgi:hypothetical protein
VGEALDMLEQVREGFAIEAAFGDDLQAADVANAFVTTLAPVATEDFVCVMAGGALTTEYRGMDGVREGWTDFLGAEEGGAVWRVRDGRISGVEFHLDRDAVLRSAGLA